MHNRMRPGSFIQVQRSPFGHGRPFSKMELEGLLAGGQFESTRWSRALYAPPFETVTRTGTGWTVEDRVGSQGRDTVASVERLEFDNIGLAFDLTGSAGFTAQIIRGLFGKAFLGEEAYVGIGMQLFDGGTSYQDIVNLAIGTGLFEQLAGSRSNTDFCRLLWTNVVGSAPTANDIAPFVAQLDAGVFTQGSLGLLACQVPFNTESAELVALVGAGLEFVPVG